MPTLFLSAPKVMNEVGSGYYRDFYTILNGKIGPDYAIYASIRAKSSTGTPVSALTMQPSRRVQRYHVHIPDLTQVPYTNPPPVNRCGVALL